MTTETQSQSAGIQQQVQEPVADRTVVMGLKSPEPFKRLINALMALTEEATFELDSEAMTVRVMDPSHIALIDVYWPNHAFERFDNENTKTIKISFRVDELAKILKDFDNKKDSLYISANGEDGMLVLDNKNGTLVKVRTIEASASSTPLPKLHFNTGVRLDYLVFDKVIKAVHKISEYVTLSSQNGKITFEGRGDSGEIAKMLEAGDEGLEELAVKEDSTASFSLDYVFKMHEAMVTKGKYEVLAEYSSKMPLRLEYRLNQLARIHFYLAPRVQD